MFKKLAGLGEMYNRYMIKKGRMEAHKILMRMDEKALYDIGISKAALVGGLSYWPWDEAALKREYAKRNLVSNLQQKQAIRELNNYSDRELHDLGLSRGMITEAVQNGRYGIEHTDVVHDDDKLQAA